MKSIFKRFFCILLFSLPLPIFSQFNTRNEWRSIQVKARSDIFFTQMENCYTLKLPGVEPGKIQMDLPELPLGTKFISSKKEEYIMDDGGRGTQISLWFTFTDSGNTRIPPLQTRINGRTHYFEFEPIYVYENPALISPVAEVIFENKHELKTDKKTGIRFLNVTTGEKIVFTVAMKYGTQIFDFKWNIPKDSIFTETERFEFANGTQRITEFNKESKNLARFEWKILREGIYPLPEILIGVISYNGGKKNISLPQDIVIKVTESQNTAAQTETDNSIFESAFTKPEELESDSKNSGLNTTDYKKIAENSKKSILDKILARRYGIFSGGQITSVPEEKANGQTFTGGQKVRITEQAGDWAFIECKEFSGWTQSNNIYEIR